MCMTFSNQVELTGCGFISEEFISESYCILSHIGWQGFPESEGKGFQLPKLGQSNRALMTGYNHKDLLTY